MWITFLVTCALLVSKFVRCEISDEFGVQVDIPIPIAAADRFASEPATTSLASRMSGFNAHMKNASIFGNKKPSFRPPISVDREEIRAPERKSSIPSEDNGMDDSKHFRSMSVIPIEVQITDDPQHNPGFPLPKEYIQNRRLPENKESDALEGTMLMPPDEIIELRKRWEGIQFAYGKADDVSKTSSQASSFNNLALQLDAYLKNSSDNIRNRDSSSQYAPETEEIQALAPSYATIANSQSVYAHSAAQASPPSLNNNGRRRPVEEYPRPFRQSSGSRPHEHSKPPEHVATTYQPHVHHHTPGSYGPPKPIKPIHEVWNQGYEEHIPQNMYKPPKPPGSYPTAILHVVEETEEEDSAYDSFKKKMKKIRKKVKQQMQQAATWVRDNVSPSYAGALTSYMALGGFMMRILANQANIGRSDDGSHQQTENGILDTRLRFTF